MNLKKWFDIQFEGVNSKIESSVRATLNDLASRGNSTPGHQLIVATFKTMGVELDLILKKLSISVQLSKVEWDSVNTHCKEYVDLIEKNLYDKHKSIFYKDISFFDETKNAEVKKVLDQLFLFTELEKEMAKQRDCERKKRNRGDFIKLVASGAIGALVSYYFKN